MAPPARIIQLIVRDSANANVDGARGRLQISTNPDEWANSEPTMGGLTHLRVPTDLQASHLVVTQDGLEASHHVSGSLTTSQIWMAPPGAAPTGPNIVNLPAFMPAPLISPLHCEGTSFVNAQGQRVVLASSTHFLYFQRLLEGQDPPEYPGNCYRITSVMSVVPKQAGFRDLRPENYGNGPEYWDALLAMADRLARLGKYFELTVHCDGAVMGLGLGWQRYHLDQVRECLSGKINWLEELTNEIGHPTNNINPRDFPRPTDGHLACWGSATDNRPPILPGWDYHTYHTRRDYPKSIVDAEMYDLIHGYQGYAGTHSATAQDEPFKAPKHGGGYPASPQDCRAYAEIAVVTGAAMVTFHHEEGVHSEPLNQSAEHADAFVKGAQAAQ